MKKINLIVLVAVIVVLLSITALSQLSPLANIMSKVSQITPTINLEENDICTTEFYEEVQNVYSNCVHYNNYTSCSNATGPNTGCSAQQDIINFQCEAKSITATKNKTECKANDYIISIGQGDAQLKKQIDFSDFGPCIYEQQNSCLVITCVSNDDGAFKGQFTDCKGGKSCQKFEICDNSIKTLYKNSREDFVADDPSFYLNKLAVAEVSK